MADCTRSHQVWAILAAWPSIRVYICARLQNLSELTCSESCSSTREGGKSFFNANDNPGKSTALSWSCYNADLRIPSVSISFCKYIGRLPVLSPLPGNLCSLDLLKRCCDNIGAFLFLGHNLFSLNICKFFLLNHYHSAHSCTGVSCVSLQEQRIALG